MKPKTAILRPSAQPLGQPRWVPHRLLQFSVSNTFQHRDIAHMIKERNKKLDEIDRGRDVQVCIY